MTAGFFGEPGSCFFGRECVGESGAESFRSGVRWDPSPYSCTPARKLSAAGARSAPLLRSAWKRAEKFGCYVRLRGLVDEEGDFMADVCDAV